MLSSLLLCALSTVSNPQPPSAAQWTIHCDQPTIQVSPDLYGIFFEEINCGGDGGLYAELVRNRGFEDSDTPTHWVASTNPDASMALDSSKPLSKQSPHSLKIEVTNPGADGYTVLNEGYWGIGIEKGKSYRFSLYSQSAELDDATVSLYDHDGKVLASQKIKLGKDGWRKTEGKLTASASDPKAKLGIRFDEKGAAWIDMVSLFPADTFKGRANGLRNDLATKLNDLHPSFMRFPGGCWVEGETMATSQRWKQTVGPLEDRRTQYDLWHYMSTNGLGYHEYLQLCEDIGAAPLFVVNVGMSHQQVVPLDQMNDYVQDAVDAIEYANDPVTSKWGALRAKNGHPKPFGLKYVEIGNENGGPSYEERYALVYKAIKAKYPEIRCIADVWGGIPRRSPVDIMDEHYYNSPSWFFQNSNRYDDYDRKGPKVYVGEYAVTQGCGQGNLIAAIGEAAFMTGMERNSDVVVMGSYAPLFANVNMKTWNPDMICYDSTRSYGTPSYYTQKLFSQNRPTQILKTDLTNAVGEKPTFPGGGIGVGTWNTQAEFKDIKVTQGDKVLFQSVDGAALKTESGDWKTVDGAFRQTSGEEPARAYAGDASWHDYTLTLKARKISGVEGFLITVGRRSNGDYLWWNIGGWGDSQGALELGVDGGKSVFGRQIRSHVDTGRWYDLKVVYSQDRIRCYQDGQVVYDEGMPVINPLHVTAGRDGKTGDLILKVVNSTKTARDMDIDLQGLRTAPKSASGQVLTSGDPLDENTLDQPTKVSPKSIAVGLRGTKIAQKLPPYSLTILRLKGAR